MPASRADSVSPSTPTGKPQLAGMALRNGVLMLSANWWAVATREQDGTIRTTTGRRPTDGSGIADSVPLLRGPVRLVNMMRVLPQVRRAVPGVRFGFQSRGMLAGVVTASVASSAVRRRTGPGAVSDLAGSMLSLVTTFAALRGGEVAAYHGAEHKAIGGYEQGIDAALATREHPRCGTNLALPLMLFSTAATQAALRLAPAHPRTARIAGQAAGVALATELFRAAQKPTGIGRSAGRAAVAAGIALQTAATTKEPDAAQLAVARAALDAVLEAEAGR